MKLRDVNDNPPQFHRPHAHITVMEDTAPGTLLATLPARDPDMVSERSINIYSRNFPSSFLLREVKSCLQLT